MSIHPSVYVHPSSYSLSSSEDASLAAGLTRFDKFSLNTTYLFVMYTFEAVVNKYLQLFFYFFFKFNRRSDLGPHALNRNTLTTKKKGAKPPRKTKVLGGFAPGTE